MDVPVLPSCLSIILKNVTKKRLQLRFKSSFQYKNYFLLVVAKLPVGVGSNKCKFVDTCEESNLSQNLCI